MARLDENLYKKLITRFEGPFAESISKLTPEEATKLVSVISNPKISIGLDKSQIPTGASIRADFGEIHLSNNLKEIKRVYVNGTPFGVKDNTLNGLEEMISGDPAKVISNDKLGRTSSGNRGSNSTKTGATKKLTSEEEFADLQYQAFLDLTESDITYDNFFSTVGPFITGKDYTAADIMTEMASYDIKEHEIPEFLAYGSELHKEIVGNLYGRALGENSLNYKFKPVKADNETFVGKLLTRLGVEEAGYDAKYGALEVDNRKITNLPFVDENGVFSNRYGKKYIPYHVGYFDETVEGSRVDKFRHYDPVEKAMDAIALQFELTKADIKFKSILDVSRNLPDFDRHPYGKELLDAYKSKIVISKDYAKTNSLTKEFEGQASEIGAVNTMILDEDAKGLIDPYGTSNGANLGYIMYLTKDAKFNNDGTFTKGEAEHSALGEVMQDFMIDKDNFNRNQMSFNALLTSVDVKKINVAYSEFALFNSEDAVVITKNGAEKMSSVHDVPVIDEEGNEVYDKFKRPVTHEVVLPMQVGDKVIDMHGNKSISSLVIDPDMDPETAKEEQLTNAVEFAKLNPDVDMVVSPVSLASRLNLGVAHEALQGEKKDLHLPDGSVVKNGIVEMNYLILPQTAEHKSKDYEIDKGSRKYTTLFRTALSSKVGKDLYEKAFLTEDKLAGNRDKVVNAFERLGVSFKDDKKLTVDGNVNLYVDADRTIDAREFKNHSAISIRNRIKNEVKGEFKDGKVTKNAVKTVNIDLGDREIISPITGKPIVDSEGRNVLPIRCLNGTQPLRFNELYHHLGSLARVDEENLLQREYDRCVSPDYDALTRKDNIIKDLKTVEFTKGAKTEMITPDPRIRLNEIRTSIDCDRVVAHRDPALHSGNTISFVNIGGNQPNLTHVNPLMINQVDGDFDSDTMGVNSFDNLNLTDKEKEIFYNRSSVTEQLNKFGEVFLATNSSHFKANVLVNGIDDSNITFADGKSNEELQEVVEGITKQIIDSPKSYGAYALDFTNDNTLKDSLGRLADDGIKGNRKDIDRHFEEGYSYKENTDLVKALISKTEWTGKAGAVNNVFVSALDDTDFDDQDLVRTGLFVMSTPTQSVLQMKKNADKLPQIDAAIKQVKQVIAGETKEGEVIDKLMGRGMLKQATDGLINPEIVDRFCDLVDARTGNYPRFGHGVVNNVRKGVSQLGYVKSKEEFNNAVIQMADGDNTKEAIAARKAQVQARMNAGVERVARQASSEVNVNPERSDRVSRALAAKQARMAARQAASNVESTDPKVSVTGTVNKEAEIDKLKSEFAENVSEESKSLDEGVSVKHEEHDILASDKEELEELARKFEEKMSEVGHSNVEGMQR